MSVDVDDQRDACTGEYKSAIISDSSSLVDGKCLLESKSDGLNACVYVQTALTSNL